MTDRDEAGFKEARKELKKEVADVVAELLGAGWTLRRAGHKFRVWCPCDDSHSIRVDGTPKNPSWHAKQVRRQAGKCPDRHELMPAKVRR